MLRGLRIICCFSLLAAAPLQAQDSRPATAPAYAAWSVDDWWRRASEWDADRQNLGALIREAGDTASAASLQFLMRLADEFPGRPAAKEAIERLAQEPSIAFVEYIAGRAAKVAKPEDKRRLWRFVDHATPHRPTAFRTFTRLFRERDADDERTFALERLGALLDLSSAPEEVALVSDTVFEIFQRTPNDAAGAAIFELSRRFPTERRIEYDTIAINAPDASFAARAAMDLMEHGVEDAERLIAGAVFGDAPFAARERLLVALARGASPVLFMRFVEAAERAPWSDIGPFAKRLADGDLRRLVPYLRTVAADGARPRPATLAALLLAAAGRPAGVESAKALLETKLPHAVVAVLAHATTGPKEEIGWNAVKSTCGITEEDGEVEALDALTDLRLGNERVRAWIRPILAGGADTYLFASALRAAAVAGEPALAKHLKAALTAKKWQIRLAAVEALVAWRDYAAVPDLIIALADDHSRIGHAAAAGLRETFGRDLGLAADQWSVLARTAPESGPIVAPSIVAAAPDRYGTRFYGIDLRSNKVVFVCDASGSMTGKKFDRLKLELARAIDGIEPPGAFNVILFSDVARGLWQGIRPASKDNKKSAHELIRLMPSRGGTDAWEALSDALADADADTIVFLTDGQPSVGQIILPPKILDAVRKVNRKKRMAIHAVWVEEKIDARTGETTGPGAEFLKNLAAENDGTFVADVVQ